MQDLIKQEKFELEVLDKLNTKRLLDNLVFCGGTMLRLCFGLERFSLDLDFWLTKGLDMKKYLKAARDYLSQSYTLKDATLKFRTLVFEIKSKDYPRALKIEVRKEIKKIETERSIAYSRYSNIQVLLKTPSLKEMLHAKVEAFLARKEIRDAFDIEFLLKKGVELDEPAAALKALLGTIDSLTKRDYQVKLGSLLEEKQRRYYTSENFKIIKLAIKGKV